METFRSDPVMGSFHLLFEVGTVAGMSDGELLDRFLARRSVGPEAAEVAFEALVQRHGPMVLRVCRTRLGDEHDAQDAFQATFLILARKAGAIRRHDSAASWLQGVARRVASCARRASAVRRAKEREASRSNLESPADSGPGELVPVIREEVGDLPEKYRTPLLLCLLDGLTHEEAATRLGWPVGTVKTRVRQAKDRLRVRLTRRGFAPSLAAITAALTAREASALPMALVRSTARASLRYASRKTMTAGVASASVAGLVELGIGSLLMSRIKMAGMLIVLCGALAAGTAGHARQGPGSAEKVEPVPIQAEVKAKLAEEPAKGVEAAVDAPDLLAEADLARIDLAILEEQVLFLKNSIFMDTKRLRPTETALDQIRQARTMEDLRKINQNYKEVDGKFVAAGPDDDFDSIKQDRMKWYANSADSIKEQLMRSRLAYTKLKRQLRHEEQRIKEMEGRAAQAGTSADRKERAEVGRDQDLLVNAKRGTAVNPDKLLIEIEEARLNLDFALNQIKESKTQLMFIMGLVKKEEAQLEQLRAARTLAEIQAVQGTTPFNMDFPAAKEQVEKTILSQYSQSKERMVHDRAAYFQAIDQFHQAEKKVKELEDQERSATDPEPTVPASADLPGGVERRLSDVERKLDLILKALEARPGAK